MIANTPQTGWELSTKKMALNIFFSRFRVKPLSQIEVLYNILGKATGKHNISMLI